MEFARSFIKVLAAVALFAVGLHFAPLHVAVASERASVSTGLDGAHRTIIGSPIKQTSAGELDHARQDCPPSCPTGCPHASSAACCGSFILTVASLATAEISATTALPREAGRSLSGIEPDALQEPPQFFA